MGAHPAPLFATERTAAQLLDMKPTEFAALVEGGHLPRPKLLGGLKRWDVQELQKIISGQSIEGEITW
ncbi:hypothetical protein HNP73_000514 [Amaricoccus macauensis]|uniref:DNA-binding protein n=1 Tax=Amaricoccus macauensis TaxID=57001 RepID=A0A840SMC2_9RHOB|nr:hypothetical protein [Amaricoccus macauensis]MBB5220593.1 hypothetical protein [Amaricoccus macauensis]